MNSYIEHQLNPGEAITYRARLHWMYVVAGLAWSTVIAAALFSVPNNAVLHGIAVVLVVLALAGAAIRYVRYVTDEYAVTTSRVIFKTGWLHQKTLEMQLNKVEGVGVDQPLFGRLLDYGTVAVGGTGGTKENFPFIQSPLAFRRQVQEEIAKLGPVRVPTGMVHSPA